MVGVRQDGVRTDEHLRAARWLARLEPARPESRIVLRTLLVADVGLLLVTAALLVGASRIAERVTRRRQQ